MRVFIAIDFPKEIKEYFLKIQGFLKEKGVKGNFSHMENFHITLKFIGEANLHEVENIKEAMNKCSLMVEPFSLTTDEIGFFKREGKKLIWMGIKEEKGVLKEFHKMVENEVEQFGFKKEEKKFNPHITLARQTTSSEDFSKIIKEVPLEIKKIEVQNIVLMESARINGKLTYIPIHTVPIGVKHPILI